MAPKATHIRVGGQWKEVKKAWTRVNGSWVNSTIPKVRVSGIWKECMSAGFNVGDIGPAGGLIIAKKNTVSDGWQYMEMAPQSADQYYYWGCTGIQISAAWNNWGFGKQNTANIVAECSESNCAARYCDDYTLNGFSDWFLWAGFEFTGIFGDYPPSGVAVWGRPANNPLPQGFQLSTVNYWSSGQSGSNGSAVKTDNPNSAHSFPKPNWFLVRPVRRF